MAHYVQIPKDLNDIKQKFMFNLTKRQVVSFGIGFAVGVPLFFLTRNTIGLSGGIIFMGCCAAPALICGLYKRNGMYFEQVIKTDLEKLLDDLNSKNERLFHINISIRNYARNKKDLKLQLELLKRICQKNNCTLMSCDYLQEDYLTSTLPLEVNNILVSREMHTSGVAIFVPFTTQELFQHNGTYYGLNTCFDIKELCRKLKLQDELAVMDGGKYLKSNKKATKKIFDRFILINITL